MMKTSHRTRESYLLLIRAYLKNRMNEVEKRDFEDQLARDPELQLDLRIFSTVIQALKGSDPV